MKRNGFVPIVIAIVIALVAAGVGFALLRKRPPPIVQNPIAAVPVPTATSTVDTTGWKTYRNEQYGFEVRYQNQLTFSDCSVELHCNMDAQFVIGYATPESIGLRELTVCDTYPDMPVCIESRDRTEFLELVGRRISLYWGKDFANTEISDKKSGRIVLTLKEMPNQKVIFKQILSTFKFTK